MALLTQHGKERVIGPELRAVLGCEVSRVDGFDTDQLGTFTRDVPRAGTQLEAARRKATIGMELAGLPLGVASEGSFGSDPFTGMLAWNTEMVLWRDAGRDLEVVGVAQGTARFTHVTATDWAAVEAFAPRAGFPDHHLVVRPDGESGPHPRKGLGTWEQLREAFEDAKAESTGGQVFVENDLRAHAHPSRMENIRLATADLAARLASTCPRCTTPGFWVVDRVPGLLCELCGTATRQPVADVHGCLRCDHRDTRPRPGPARADPATCDYCNP
ncbi:DUF6671 family protein [Cellulomonas bogoriensis]|uniref:DUF6671 domain-containing protein n=1 Tax=Cellulomonas bogoriensis 69B4 = DSM 16987 TaxID=1386082 RepID=A0A0A0C114_9CELL|nr:DUF6671 family protein [Cellulomonas bogoriensis]KGM13642.1 hypothetical protein N869_07430 [Cellulomonas bogoriensis 69B4 = DSM 16987]